MPQIPRQQRQVQPTSTSMPRAPLNMEGSHPLIGLGATLGDFASQMDKARESSQLATAQTTWKEGMANFGNDLESDVEYQTFEKRFDVYAKNLHKDISSKMTHKGASGIFSLWTRDALLVEKANTRHRANQLEIQFMEADYFKNLTLATKREDKAFIVNSTQNAIEAGYVKPLVGAKAQEQALEKLEWTTAWNDIVNVTDKDKVTAILNDTDLSLTRKNSLVSTWQRGETAKQARAKEEQKEKEEEARATILSQLRNGTITEGEIGASALSTEEKYKWQERLHKRNKQVASNKDNLFDILDPALDARIMKAVYSDTPPAKEEIQGYVGAGLTVARAEHWINQLEKPDKGYKRALEYLQSQIMPRQALTVGESSPNSASYWQAVLALDEHLQTDEGQKISGNAILQKAVEMAPDYVLTLEEQVEAAKKIWSKGKETPEPEPSWWEKTKDWISGSGDEVPPEVEKPKTEIEKQMTDEEIGQCLDENGYVSNPEAIAIFRKNNGL